MSLDCPETLRACLQGERPETDGPPGVTSQAAATPQLAAVGAELGDSGGVLLPANQQNHKRLIALYLSEPREMRNALQQVSYWARLRRMGLSYQYHRCLLLHPSG